MRGLFVVVVLIATLVSQGTAQLPFGPEFHLSQYQTNEGETLVVRLSAPFLTRAQTPAFTGSIEVDVTAEDGSAQLRTDYIISLQNISSRTFTVIFQSKQANSTEHQILISDDRSVEGTEEFLLRIDAVRFTGQATVFFKPSDGFNNTVVDVFIADDDFIEVSWTISDPIEVTEGNESQMIVRLRAQAFGFYATPIEIGVVCAEVIVTGVPPAYPDVDFFVINGSSLLFIEVGSERSTSVNELVLSIYDDNITEPCESFICTLQGGALDAVRGVEPNRVTVRICDDDELIIHWAQDVYRFSENQVAATVELVTDSIFEVDRVSIQGFPRQIPDGDPNRFPTLVVPGPAFPGLTFDSTIERVFVSVPTTLFGERIFGNAQVTQSGRSDAVNTINDFVFTPNSTSAFESFTIVDDDVLEFDEIFIAEFSFGPEIANNWNARQVEPITAFILIRDDDSVEVNFNENSYCVAESDGQVSVSLRIDGQFFIPVWAVVEIGDGTATDPEDYSSAMRYNVTFRQTTFTDVNDPDPTTLSSPILTDITTDDIFEGMEYFQARIVETSDSIRVRIGQDTVNVTIKDNVTVRYEEEMYRVDEEAGYVTLALVLEGNVSVPVTVTVRTLGLLDSSVGDAATASDDYIPRGPFDITFQPESRRVLFNVTIVDDGIPESSEFFNADIVSAGPGGVIIREPRQPVIEILDRVDKIRNGAPSSTSGSGLSLDITGLFVGDMATFTCNTGYELIGSATLTCQSSGTWSDPVPTCRIIDCGDPGHPDNGRRILQGGTTYQSNVTYECDPGFRLVGVSFRTCRADGSWSGSQPSCMIIDCGDPGHPDNGRRILQGGTTYQSNVTYECDPGFSLVGVSFRTCRADGTWSGSQPSCTTENVTRCNDTIIGDPSYEVPVVVDAEGNKVSLCYEIRGEANQHFNLISDTCVSVNALYSPITPSGGNFIRKIGVLAEDSNGMCQQIEADLAGCTARVNGNNVTMYNQDDVLVMRRTNRIRISVPNCNNIDLVMWVICEDRGDRSMIKFVVARGFNLNPTSHGLIGQFWNIKVEAEKYNVTASDKISPAEGHYAVTVNTPAGATRRFFAWKLPRTWDKKSQTCLYAGDSQGYVPYEVTSLSGSVIEGTYAEYIVSGLFATDYKYEMFDSMC